MLSDMDHGNTTRQSFDLVSILCLIGLVAFSWVALAKGRQGDYANHKSPEDTFSKLPILPGEGTKAFTVKDTGSHLRKILGQPDQVRVSGADKVMLDYRQTHGVDFLVDLLSDKILEIRFNRGYKGETPQGITLRDSLDKVLSASGGARETVEATGPQTHSVLLGKDRVLYKQRNKGKVLAYKFMDGRHGILYWFDKEKKVMQIVVFEPCSEG